MQLWNVGDKSEAICANCGDLVATTFAERTVYLEKAGAEVQRVLVAVCDRCGEILAIPAQSEPQLKEAREKHQTIMRARISRGLEDALRLIAAHYNVRDQDFRAPLLRYYLYRVARDEDFARRVRELVSAKITEGKASSRIEFRLTCELRDRTLDAATRAGIESESELVRGVIAAAAEDVLEQHVPSRLAELEMLAATA